MDLTILVPMFNEVDNVDTLRRDLLPVALALTNAKVGEHLTIEQVELVIVDDGSTDGTLDKLQVTLTDLALPGVSVNLCRHPSNLGLGAALRTGFAAAKGGAIVTTDSDGTYRFTEIPRLLAGLAPDVSIITASPYHPSGRVENVPGFRLLFSRGSSLIYRALVSWRVHTYTALFRAYRRNVIEQIPFESDGFLAGTELLVKSMLSGFRVVEYPTTLHSRVHGTSKAKIMYTIQTHLAFQGQVLAWRMGFGRESLHPHVNVRD